MTTHAPMAQAARVPFGSVDASRLHQMASAKNRQNGMHMQQSPLGAKAGFNTKEVISTKRSFDSSSFDELDAENIDPAAFDSPSKKAKSDVLDFPVKPCPFSLSTTKISMPPPSTVPSHMKTPPRTSQPSPRAALTAPAGRSPKRKAAGILKNRRSSAPYTRVDPPSASTRHSSSLPFSLDAALNGTVSAEGPAAQSTGATIPESKPRSWFFDIYEDTPEEEAGNLMEHSTLTLDLSSDDESTPKHAERSRGKENTPPEGYDAPTASRPSAITEPATTRAPEIVRKKTASNAMDDGLRSPLADLETDPFIPAGLSKDSHVVVDASSAATAKPEQTAKLNINDLFTTPAVPFTAGSDADKTAAPSELCDFPVVDSQGAVKGEIIFWQDEDASSN